MRSGLSAHTLVGMSSYGDYPGGPGWSTVSGEYPRADEGYRAAAPVSPPMVTGRAQVPVRMDGPFQEGETPAPPRGRPPPPTRPTRSHRIRRQVLLRRKRTLMMAFAAFLILFGTTAVVGTYYLDSVGVLNPENLANAQTTKLMADDGK